MLFLIQRGFRSSMPMRAKKDFYKTLGVSRSASESEIKKAYFSLAKQYHPDVNKSPDAKTKFSEISTAYETLGNTEKRRLYDNTGMTGDEQEQAKSSGFDPGFGGGFNPFGGGGGGFGNFQDIFQDFEEFFSQGRTQKKAYKGEDITISLEIPFLDAAHGASRQVRFERKGTCTTCNGTKTRPGTSPSKCMNCGGRGVVFMQRGPMSIQSTCQKCKGLGTIIKNPCSTCRGVGFAYNRVMETVEIPAGVNSGQTLRMSSKGHSSETAGPAGDLNIKVVIGKHPVFSREGFNVLSEVGLSIAQAVLGTSLEVPTIHGDYKVNIPPGASPGENIKIPGKGIQHLPPNSHKKGDHFAKVKIAIPKRLSEKQKKLFEELASLEKA